MKNDNGKKRILFISSNLKPGGIQNVLSNLSGSLNHRFDLSILLDNDDEKFFEFHGDVLPLGVRNPNSYNNLFYQFKILVKRMHFLHRHRNEFDYVVSVKDSAHLPNILTRHRGGKTIIAIYCNVLSMAKVSWGYKLIVKPLTRLMYNMADALFVTSEGVKNQLERFDVDAHKMHVIYDGVNVENIERLANEPLAKRDIKDFAERPIICALGRLDPVKGYNYLIRVVKLLAQEIPDILLLIMGSGTERSNLEAQIKELKLEDNVKLMGFVENPYKYIKYSRLYVMSSVAEGFPTVLMEAMVCGTPIISTDMESGAREILAPNTDLNYKNRNEIEYAEYGVLVPTFEPDDLTSGGSRFQEALMAEGIKKMLNDNDKCEEYMKRYSLHKKDLSYLICADQWEIILNDLISV